MRGLAEGTFGQWRAADIAKANKEDGGLLHEQ